MINGDVMSEAELQVRITELESQLATEQAAHQETRKKLIMYQEAALARDIEDLVKKHNCDMTVQSQSAVKITGKG